MRRLFLRLLRNGGFFVFIMLEAISLSLVVRYNEKPSAAFTSSSNTILGFMYRQVDELARVSNLSAVTDSLARENARLYAQLEIAKLEQATKRDTAQTITQQWYSYIPASVRNNSTHLNNNTITIDVGYNQGVKPGMGVIGPNGVVGQIIKTTSRFSSALSLLHSQTRVSTMIQGSNHFGILTWPGKNIHTAILTDVPKHAQIKKGDLLITSGYSTVFPKGIPIGVVKDYRAVPGTNSLEIEVTLATDMSNLHQVYVLDNLFRTELDSLIEVK